MIAFELTRELLAVAAERASQLPIYEYSHRGRDANLVGTIGEVVVEGWLTAAGVGFRDRRDQTTHDYELHDGTSFDVKTKDRTVAPRATYACTVPAYNHAHQRPDGFVFVSLQRDRATKGIERFHTAHLLGLQSLRFVEERGQRWGAGETDPDNGTTFWTDCINIDVADLADPAVAARVWALRSPA